MKNSKWKISHIRFHITFIQNIYYKKSKRIISRLSWPRIKCIHWIILFIQSHLGQLDLERLEIVILIGFRSFKSRTNLLSEYWMQFLNTITLVTYKCYMYNMYVCINGWSTIIILNAHSIWLNRWIDHIYSFLSKSEVFDNFYFISISFYLNTVGNIILPVK